MPRLALVEGIAGSGKSTISRCMAGEELGYPSLGFDRYSIDEHIITPHILRPLGAESIGIVTRNLLYREDGQQFWERFRAQREKGGAALYV